MSADKEAAERHRNRSNLLLAGLGFIWHFLLTAEAGREDAGVYDAEAILDI